MFTEAVATEQKVTVLAVFKMGGAMCSWRVTRNGLPVLLLGVLSCLFRAA
jgi:hypothetical protein